MRWWLLGAVLAIAACDGGTKDTGDSDTTSDPTGTQDRIDHIVSLTGDPTAGEQVYTDNCQVCHAASGLGVDDPDQPGIGDNLTEAAGETGSDAEFAGYILNGKGSMTAFAGILDDQQIADVLAYVHDGLIQ